MLSLSYAVVAAVLAWMDRFANRRVVIFVDNMSVKFMINNNSSKCKNCMVLIRILVLHSLRHNVSIYAKHVKTLNNGIADSLSCFQTSRFRRLTKRLKMDPEPNPIPDQIWPISKVWLN